MRITKMKKKPGVKHGCALAMLSLAPQVFAADFGKIGEVDVRWDNTAKYSAVYRVTGVNKDVAIVNDLPDGTVNPGLNMGDLSWDKGIVSNRLDLLSELDLKYKDIGMRVSAAAWYDHAYSDDTTDFDGAMPNTVSQVLGLDPYNKLPSETIDIMKSEVELLDAFVYGNTDLFGKNLSVRLGRHTQLYGESLFLGANAVAAAQMPVDVIKALSLPNAQFKEVAIPVGQVSFNYNLSPVASIGAYYQYEWEHHRLPPVGSYFSPGDIIGDGSDLMYHPIPFGTYTTPASRGSDYSGSDSGQFGIQLKYSAGDIDYGFYAARYHDKAPVVVLDLFSILGGEGELGGGVFNHYYAQDIEVYGASASTLIGDSNVAGEISIRRNVPLAVPGDIVVNSTIANPDNKDNTPYAKGDTLHINLSTISFFPENELWDAAVLIAELGYNTLLNVTHDPGAAGPAPEPLNANHTRSHAAVKVLFEPQFFQVKPGIDLSMPIGLTYGIHGKSSFLQMAPYHGGDFSIGLKAMIDRKWNASLNYTNFFGSEGSVANTEDKSISATYPSYKQYYADRDYISFSVSRTF